MIFTSQSLRDAVSTLPVSSSVPAAKSPELQTEHPDTPSTPTVANSNDLLPIARGPNTLGARLRKRRKVRTPADRGDAAFPANSTIFSEATSFRVARPYERLADVGGIDSIVSSITELISWPLRHGELYTHLGVEPPRGILLHGPPGCGKTLLAHAIAGELDVALLKVSAPEIVSGMSGESERKLRRLFAEASKCAPSIIFIDEIDTIASRREDASKDMGKRIVAQLLTCIDGLGSRQDETLESTAVEGSDIFSRDAVEDTAPTVQSDPSVNGKGDLTTSSELNCNADVAAIEDAMTTATAAIAMPVVVIAATNRPEVIEPALRRAGRFDREIEIGAPDDMARYEILKKVCRNLKVSQECDFRELARRTAGYVGADLELLAKEAGVHSIRRFVRGHSDCSDEARLVFETVSLADGKKIARPCRSRTVAEMKQDHAEHRQIDPSASGCEPLGMDENSLGTNGKCSDIFKNDFRYTRSDLDTFSICMDDFIKALDQIQPSALREGFATRPNVSWDDVGALEDVRDDLSMAIIEPIRVPERFSRLGLSAAAGVLLYGPPGCGKTLLAKAVAAESGANFISVKGPELLSKFVGDSELAVRKLFNRARASAPCIVFFDELDALAPRRGGMSTRGGSDSGASERVVNMLLTEMDGFDVRKQVFLIAATNRPDIIDPAMLRPGRLDKLLYVPLPSDAGRASILKKMLKRVSVAADVDVHKIATDRRCTGFSGADMQALVRAAGENVLRESRSGHDCQDVPQVNEIQAKDFEIALQKVLPSVSPRDAVLYRSMEVSLRKSRAHLDMGGDDMEGDDMEVSK